MFRPPTFADAMGFLLGLAVANQGLANDLDYSGAITSLKRHIARDMRQDKVVGASIALIEDQQVIWADGFGYADRGEKIPATAATIYQAGDLTKIITAIAALQLVDAGQVSLDATLDELLPDLVLSSRFRPQASPSLRQLLSHHSGISTARWAGAYQARPQTELLPLTQAHVSQPTGAIYAYSNLAFEAVGQIIQRYSRRPYVDSVTTTVLDPLGMTKSGFRGQAVATGYDRRRVGQTNFPRDVASLGLFTSVNDAAQLVHWWLRESNGEVLSGKLRKAMEQPNNSHIALDLDNRTGLAWQLTNTGRHGTEPVLRINASTLDFRGIVLIAPREKLGVVLFSNSATATDLVIDTSRLALDELLWAKAGIPKPDFDNDVPDEVALNHGVDDNLAPSYSSALGIVEFSGDSAREHAYLLGRKFIAKRRGDGWYQLSYRLLGVLPLRFGLLRDILLRPAIVDGQRSLLVFYQHQEFLLGTALEPANSGADLADLAGTYQLLNPDPLTERLNINQVVVRQESGRLVASYRLPLMISLHLRLPLQAIGENRFVVPGLGTNLGDIVTFSPTVDGLTLRYSGYEFLKAP